MLIDRKIVIGLGIGLSILATTAFADDQPSVLNGVVSGNIGAVTKYIYRGGVENDDIALQGGLTYTHNSGVFVGYWGSTLDYDPKGRDHGSEHDFSIGFANTINDDWSYSSQIMAYVYQNGGNTYNDARTEKRSTTGYDLVNDISYKDLSLGLTVSLADADYGNAGDVYLSAAYSYALPYEFSLNTSVGASIYNDGRDDSIVQTAHDFTMNEVRLGLSKPLLDTGIEMSLDYIWGGRDRYDEKLDDHLVYGVTYSF